MLNMQQHLTSYFLIQYVTCMHKSCLTAITIIVHTKENYKFSIIFFKIYLFAKIHKNRYAKYNLYSLIKFYIKINILKIILK